MSDSIHRSISDYQLELDSAPTIKATTAGLDVEPENNLIVRPGIKICPVTEK